MYSYRYHEFECHSLANKSIFIKSNRDGHVLDNPVMGSGHLLLFKVKCTEKPHQLLPLFIQGSAPISF